MTTDAEKFVRFCESELGQKVLEKEAGYVYRELKDCKKILDIGCGIGQFEQKLQDLNVIGLDISEEMLKEARKRSSKTFVLGDAENLNFLDSSFDAVFYITTLEFLNDYKRAIEEAWRATKINGKILVMMLNPEYFHEHINREGSYFRKIKHTNLREIGDYVSRFYRLVKEEYFLGIEKRRVFNTFNKEQASLYVIVGQKTNPKTKHL